jgi:alpha,alpha-trehalase
MKKCWLIIVVFFSVQLSAQVQSPDVVYAELFSAVQRSGIFKDSKTFVDAIPKKDPKQILADYRRVMSNPAIRFSLQRFIEANFTLPDTTTAVVSNKPAVFPVRQHIKKLWSELQRKADVVAEGSTLLPLPNSYIIPGGRFREIYYWDSYFTMLGLQEDGLNDVVENMINNFASLIDRYGFIPNGNRSYYLSRSQPPFFAAMINLLAEKKGQQVLVKYLPQLEKEYNYWMQKGKSAVSVSKYTVNRNWDERDVPRPESYAEDVQTGRQAKEASVTYQHLRAAAASGWDFSSRWNRSVNLLSTIHTLDIVPVDLNSLLYNLETTISNAYRLKGDAAKSKKYVTLSDERKRFLILYCWNAQDGFFYDYDFVTMKQIKVRSLATAYPLFFKIATDIQAKSVAKNLDKEFLKPGGFTTTTNKTGQQWDAPNGWAPLQWITVQGLNNYNQKQLAETAAKRWIDLNVAVYNRTGRFMEKYNVYDTSLIAGGGEYPTQDGFGWTNGVLLKLINIYKYEGTLPASKAIPMILK